MPKKSAEDRVKEMEREMKKIACALELKKPTTTKEGMRNRRQLARKVERATREKGLTMLSPWEKIKKAFKEFLDEELEI